MLCTCQKILSGTFDSFEFGGNHSTGRTLGGFNVMVKGGVVSLKAQEQGGVTHSANEAETITFTDTAAAAI
jgi:hypothetical protein